VLYSIHVCRIKSIVRNSVLFFFFRLAVIISDQLPSYLQQISPVSDTILLFKEDNYHPDVVIKDVSRCGECEII
jgi:hypothetical protein